MADTLNPVQLECSAMHLRPPVVPLYSFFGRVPLLKSTTDKQGTLLLTSLLEDLGMNLSPCRTLQLRSGQPNDGLRLNNGHPVPSSGSGTDCGRFSRSEKAE